MSNVLTGSPAIVDTRPANERARRHPLRALAHRLSAYRRRPHGAVQLAVSRAGTAARCCCGSRIPTASAQPQAAIDAIIDGLTWLGLDWDGEIVYQFARAARHREVAEQLLAAGHAYRCYRTPGELTAMREKARARGPLQLYDGRWRDRDPTDAPAGVKPVIRLKAPLTGETVIEDQVQGRVVWQNENLDDFVLLRSDGTPTYMLAVVVDDHDMGVTHIIRGDDHLNNAARQTQIYEALGWKVPIMAHIPLIHGPDGSKLSKRHGALGVDAYRAMGYLPAAMRNYLVRLGWSHGDQEIFSTEEMIAAFDLPQIGRSPARFDFAKLENLNGHYMRASADADLVAAHRAALAHIAGGAGAREQTDAGAAHQAAGCHARIEGARQDSDRAGRQLPRFLWTSRPLEIDEQGQGPAYAEAKTLISALCPSCEAVDRLECASDRSWRCAPLRSATAQARRRRAAVAGGADRQDHLARQSSTCWRCWAGTKAWPGLQRSGSATKFSYRAIGGCPVYIRRQDSRVPCILQCTHEWATPKRGTSADLRFATARSTSQPIRGHRPWTPRPVPK